MNRPGLLACLLLTLVSRANAEISPSSAAAYLDFRRGPVDQANGDHPLVLHELQPKEGQPLEFTSSRQYAETDEAGTAAIARKLDGATAASVGVWVQCRRSGEQTFVERGKLETAPLGERMFRPQPDYVDFCVGTDQHGFLFGTMHGNGMMPFPLVTLNEAWINTWIQWVVVKDADGYQKFYENGTLVLTDEASCWSPRIWPFHETGKAGPVPLRLSVPLGGLLAEAWVFPRALSATEVRDDYEAKHRDFRPALPGRPVALREMDSHPATNLWAEPPTAENWPRQRERILAGVYRVLGQPPRETVPLEPRVEREDDCGSYVRRLVSIAVQPNDRMPAWLLIPKRLSGRVPAIVCFYGTTSGAGKDTTVGLSGSQPGTPPRKNRAFAVDMAEAGFVALACDYLRDGQRVRPGQKPYDSSEFYRQFPEWSVVGKDAWDNSRAIDYLQTLDFVDPERIGMIGHSYGGHSTIFAAALEPRIKVAVANGPVSEFRDHGSHWGRPLNIPGGELIRGMRPYVLDHELPLPVTFYEFTALIAPRPLWIGEAVGERRPKEEENYAAVSQVYRALGAGDRVTYQWYPGDHDFPPAARQAAIAWFRQWFASHRP